MYIIQLLYSRVFNHYVKTDGYHRIVHFAASISLLVLLMFLIADLFLILNIIFDGLIGFRFPKPIVFFAILIGSVLNHLFMFNVLKLEKKGNTDDHLFPLDSKEKKRANIIIFTILLCFFVLVAIDIRQQEINEQKTFQQQE